MTPVYLRKHRLNFPLNLVSEGLKFGIVVGIFNEFIGCKTFRWIVKT
jgi:hypothetical protein